MVVIVFEEKVLVATVASKCDSGDAEPGEAGLKAVPSRERSLISPCLAVRFEACCALVI